MKSEGTKNVLLGVLIVGLVSMTVAFAALSTNLSISSTASIPAQSWDVELTNWTLDTANTTAGYTTTPNSATSATSVAITEGTATATQISGYNFDFKRPGTQVQYTFDIENLGTIDARNSALTVGTPACTHKVDNVDTAITCPETLSFSVSCGGSALVSGTPMSTVLKGTGDSQYASGSGKTSCTYTVAYTEVTNTTNTYSIADDISITGLDVSWTWTQN